MLPITPEAIKQQKPCGHGFPCPFPQGHGNGFPFPLPQGHGNGFPFPPLSSGADDLVSAPLRANPGLACALQFPSSTTPQAKMADVAMFTHSVRTCANSVKFSHQSLCNPKISSLMKASRKGFLNGCPNISKELVTKYLNPSPATAKGHMKRPKKGIRSTQNR